MCVPLQPARTLHPPRSPSGVGLSDAVGSGVMDSDGDGSTDDDGSAPTSATVTTSPSERHSKGVVCPADSVMVRVPSVAWPACGGQR